MNHQFCSAYQTVPMLGGAFLTFIVAKRRSWWDKLFFQVTTPLAKFIVMTVQEKHGVARAFWRKASPGKGLSASGFPEPLRVPNGDNVGRCVPNIHCCEAA